MKNKRVKQMICDCNKSRWGDFELTSTRWVNSSIQMSGNWKGRGFSRFFVNHDKASSLTADQHKAIK